MVGIEAMAGALLAQSFVSYYIYEKFNKEFFKIGYVIAACMGAAGISSIVLDKFAEKIGRPTYIICIHALSNTILFYISFLNAFNNVVLLLVIRFLFSQINRSAGQQYISAYLNNKILFIVSSLGVSFGLGLKGLFMGI